jgi:MFS family permease
MCTPAIPLIQADFKSNGNSKIYNILYVSIWELGEAFGPLLIAPLSEYFGRYRVYHTANIMFVVFCITSALSRNTAMLVVSRFFNGLSVASITLNAAIVGDLFVTEEQGTAQALMGLAPLIGPVLGPTIGGYIAQSIGWRWMFWILAIASGVVELVFFLVFRETYALTILRRKTKRLRKETGNPLLRPAIDRPHGVKNFFSQAIVRPARMLILSPVILVLAIYVSLIFAYLYILFTNITQDFETTYGFSTGDSGLVYIGLGK